MYDEFDVKPDSLIPFALTWRKNIEHLQLDIPGLDVEIIDVEDESREEFARLLNLTNQLAFGGAKNMGMPLWVMLDCAILPSAIAGFMLPRDQTPESILRQFEIDDEYDDFVPVSEYCGCPTLIPGCISGFSLLSHIHGQGLATRTKALAMLMYGATSQIGVTQFDNPAIRVHARFGPMEIKLHRPSIHTHPLDSFVYEIELPGRDVLASMATGENLFGVHTRPQGIDFLFDPQDEVAHGKLSRHLERGGRAWIIPPGWHNTPDGCTIDIILSS